MPHRNVKLLCDDMFELLEFSVDGKMLYSGEEEAAFKGFEIGAGFVPAVTLAVGQEVALHFGKQSLVICVMMCDDGVMMLCCDRDGSL